MRKEMKEFRQQLESEYNQKAAQLEQQLSQKQTLLNVSK
jgi:hypothetical protein